MLLWQGTKQAGTLRELWTKQSHPRPGGYLRKIYYRICLMLLFSLTRTIFGR